MISGATRFVYGTLQLVLLSLGIVAGLQLVGIPAVTVTVAETEPSVIGAIAPWIGVLVFGFGSAGRADRCAAARQHPLVRLHVPLRQAGHRHDGSRVTVSRELDAVGRARPVWPGVHDLAMRPVLDHYCRAAVEVMRGVDWRERLEGHL